MSAMLRRYWPLLGRYIDASRPRAEEEYKQGDPPTIGAGGVVVGVISGGMRVGGESVELVLDYGMSILIVDEDEWTIKVYASEADAPLSPKSERAIRYRERRRRERIERVAHLLGVPLAMLGQMSPIAVDLLASLVVAELDELGPAARP